MKRAWIAAIVAMVFGVAALAMGGCSGPRSSVPNPVGVAQETTQTSVFYSTGRSLFEELKVVDAKDPYKSTLDELLRAQPETNEEIAIVQPAAKIRSLTLDGGVATADWDRAVLEFEASDPEKVLALGAVLQTLGQWPEIERVRFTVEGKTTGTIGGKDVEAFWGRISLKGMPWKVLRLPGRPGSTTTTSTEATGK